MGNSEEFIKTIRQSRKNNIKYQEKLFKQFYTYTMSICLRYAASKEEAEEILNDSFLKVFKSLKKYDESRTFKPWIRRIIINTSIDYNRKKNSHLQIVVDKETALMSDCTDQLDQFNAEDVMAILQRLPDLLRVVFNMYELDGYSHKEIASNLRITESTSRAYLTRAKAKLRELFTKSLPYEY